MTTLPEAQYLLPPSAYWDPEWYEREMRELFAKTWNLVAYRTDLAEPGDHLPVTVGNEPILLVHQDDGTIAAFVNMCRHRGMVMFCEAGRADRLRCMYHGWEYENTGTLVRIPQRRSQFPGVDTAEWGLIPVACGEWDGMIFVNPSRDAAPFADWLGDYPAHCGPFQLDRLVEVRRHQVDIACNWKLYIENHIDVLHLWYLHEDSLGMYDHRNFAHAAVGPHWVSSERLRPGAIRERTNMSEHMRPISHLPAEERDVLRANLLFPNVPMSSSETLYMTYQVVPTGPTTSRLDIRVRAEPGSVLDDDGLAELCTVLVSEDATAVERIQDVIQSERFGVGPLAIEHERPITEFHEAILRRLG